VEDDAEARRGRETGAGGDLGHGQVGVGEEFFGAIDVGAADLIRDGVADELPEPALEGATAEGDVVEDVVYLERLGGVLADKADGEDDVFVFDRQNIR
jgi:hypothetical protein